MRRRLLQALRQQKVPPLVAGSLGGSKRRVESMISLFSSEIFDSMTRFLAYVAAQGLALSEFHCGEAAEERPAAGAAKAFDLFDEEDLPKGPRVRGSLRI